jgi:hypothetical protein
MNIYLVVEGPVGEKRVYSSWVPLVNPNLIVKESIVDVTHNCLYIISGGGYPNYFDVISDGVKDVSDTHLFDRLVVAVDSEDMSYDEKREEVVDFIEGFGMRVEYRVIVQHFCLETWALGNRVIVTRYPQNPNIRIFRRIFDVLTEDPELLPDLPDELLTRAQFAEKYLRGLLNEKYRNLTYSKRNPTALLNYLYFERVKSRFIDTRHIASFNDFLQAFV